MGLENVRLSLILYILNSEYVLLEKSMRARDVLFFDFGKFLATLTQLCDWRIYLQPLITISTNNKQRHDQTKQPQAKDWVLIFPDWFIFKVNTYTKKGFIVKPSPMGALNMRLIYGLKLKLSLYHFPEILARLHNSIPLTKDISFCQYPSWVVLNQACSMRAPAIKSAQGLHMAKSGPERPKRDPP